MEVQKWVEQVESFEVKHGRSSIDSKSLPTEAQSCRRRFEQRERGKESAIAMNEIDKS